jgi:hypothetical protein
MEQLLEKLFLFPPDAMPAIRSVIGRVSFPGSVFMEAVNIEAVYDACKGLKHVSSMNDICVISLQEAMLYLREQATYTPHSPGWV